MSSKSAAAGDLFDQLRGSNDGDGCACAGAAFLLQLWRTRVLGLSFANILCLLSRDRSSNLLASYRFSSLSAVYSSTSLIFVFKIRDSRLDQTSFESSLSSNFPLVQLPLASPSCMPRVRALRLPQSFGRSSEEPLQVTHVCCFE